MFPKTWLPTCTFTTGLSVAGGGYCLRDRATRDDGGLIVVSTDVAALPHNEGDNENREDQAIQAEKRFMQEWLTALISRRQEEEVRRYIEIYSIMLRNSLIRELSFKANFSCG